MFAKSGIAALITGGVFIALTIPVMLWVDSASKSRPLRLYPRDEPFDPQD